MEEGEGSDGPIDSEEDMQRASALDSATFQFMKYPFPGFSSKKYLCKSATSCFFGLALFFLSNKK